MRVFLKNKNNSITSQTFDEHSTIYQNIGFESARSWFNLWFVIYWLLLWEGCLTSQGTFRFLPIRKSTIDAVIEIYKVFSGNSEEEVVPFLRNFFFLSYRHNGNVLLLLLICVYFLKIRMFLHMIIVWSSNREFNRDKVYYPIGRFYSNFASCTTNALL